MYTRPPLNSADFRKLITHEDNQMIHKTLGLCSIVSFVYRYGYVYNTTGTLGFEGTYMDWVTMVIHTLLAFSSIIFRYVLLLSVLARVFRLSQPGRPEPTMFALWNIVHILR